MKYKSRFTSLFFRAAVLAGVVVVASSAARSDPDPTLPQQDIIRLESRIGQLEQRLMNFDTSLRNLEQQVRLANPTARGVRPEDLLRLQSEVLNLQRRLSDHECALAKLDERTLAPALREERMKSGASADDPCRNNFSSPLRLSGQ